MTDGLPLLAAWLMFGALVIALITVVLRRTNDDPLVEVRRVVEQAVPRSGEQDPDDVA